MLERRSILGTGLALTMLVGAARAEDPPPGGGMRDSHAMPLADCAALCLETHRSCIEAARHCLEEGGDKAAPGIMAILADCAGICLTTAQSLLRNSPAHGVLCQTCDQICRLCAENCAAFTGDAQLLRCANLSRRCAEGCGMMVMSS